MTTRGGSTTIAEQRWQTDPWWESGPLKSGTSLLTQGYSLTSSNHPGWSELRGSRSDVGGSFDLRRSGYLSVAPAQCREDIEQPPWNDRYTGDLIPLPYSSEESSRNAQAFGALSVPQMESFGTTAISRTLPNNPAFDLPTFFGETLSEGMPTVSGLMLLKEYSKALRSVSNRDRRKAARELASGGLTASSSEYLNLEFGWKPLIADLRSFAETVKNSHEILENYRAGSDRKIKRRYAFPESRYENKLSGELRQVNPSGGSFSIAATGDVVTTSTRNVWFSGAYRYHIPVGVNQAEKWARFSSAANKLLGINLTPETVWNLSPWTWAVDWFTNAGDLINNISSLGSDGLVLQYGYVMAHARTLHEYKNFRTTRYGKSYVCSCTRVYESKQREPATPYGFGLSQSSLTARQWAILTALGITKGSRA